MLKLYLVTHTLKTRGAKKVLWKPEGCSVKERVLYGTQSPRKGVEPTTSRIWHHRQH
jgi:hypothetical protein